MLAGKITDRGCLLWRAGAELNVEAILFRMMRDVGEADELVERCPDQVVVGRCTLLEAGDVPVESVEEAAKLSMFLAENA